MNATTLIHETASVAKPAFRSRKLAEAEACYTAAMTASEGFPALQAVVEAWRPLRLRQAELDAVHSETEARQGVGGADDAEKAWNEAEDQCDEIALSILDLPPQGGRFGAARLDTLQAFYPGPKLDETLDLHGARSRLLEVLRADLGEPEAFRAANAMWDDVIEALRTARAASDAAIDAENSAIFACDTESELARPEPLVKAGIHSVCGLERSTLSFAEKVELAPLAQAWEADYDAISERHGVIALGEAATAAGSAVSEAEDRLLATPAVDLRSVVEKLAIAIGRLDEDSALIDLKDPETLARFLAEPDKAQYAAIARVFLEALRLAEPDHPAAQVQVFDPEAWAAEFEAHPGHRLTQYGPEYEEPIAWGSEMPACGKASPTGALLWRELANWQKAALRNHAKLNPSKFPFGHAWTGEAWIEAFEAEGGRVDLLDGEVVIGAPVPSPRPLLRLWEVLDRRGLKHAVAAIMLDRKGAAR